MKAGGKRAHGRAAGRWQEDMHMHGWEGGRVAGAVRNGAAGEEDLHVDASAVVRERGQRVPRSGGANK